MSDISKIKIPNGNEYDLKDVNGRKEAYLTWGGKHFSASYGPIDAAMIGALGANRFAFLKAAGLTIEYSTDGGETWIDYGGTDIQKTGLFGNGQSFSLGKHTAAGSSTLGDMLRVTIATGAAGIYTTLNKIAIYMSTSGNTVQVKMEKALESAPDNYNTHLDWTGISGWSGWNILNISNITTYGNSPNSQYGRIRFIFKQTAITTKYAAANISIIMGFGGVGWSTPSNMARTGHLYSYDNGQNATFPAQVTATAFNGNATSSTNAKNLLAYNGNEAIVGANNSKAGSSTNDSVWFNYRDILGGSISNSATKLIHYHFGNRKGSTSDVTVHAATFDGNLTGSAAKVNNHTVNSDVPANAKFTDTTYQSKAAVSGGTDVSLVTTGEKYIWNNKTANTGTVTKVTAGTGLSIGSTAGGNFTTSGTINHTNSVTAQNTQAIYPIKIDAQGHISAYGSAVTPLTASSTLDATKLDGTIPTACLPSYVDDVLQYTAKANFPTTGEAGKIYVDKTTNLTWRWGGSSYVEISPSLALGTTSSTAFRGDYGDAAYAHAVTNKGSAFSSGLYKITTNSEGHVTAATAVQKSDITGLGIPGSNTNTIGEYAGSCIAGPNGIARYSLMMKVDETHWQSLVLSSSTGTTKVKNTSGFIIDSPILYESAGTYTSGTAAGQSACWQTMSFDTRYSTNGGQFSTAGKPFYLVGTITNNKFYLANTWWADALPATDSDNVYIYIGQMYSKYQCTLQSVHPIYIHKDGKIQEWFSTKHVLISTTQPTNQQPGDYWFVTEEHIALDYQQMPNDYGGNTAYISSIVQEG